MAVQSVYEVTQIIKHLMTSTASLQDLTVRGEISNFSRPASGHIYFTLKDDKARLRIVMFAGKARFLRFRPADGMSVIVHGALDVFERSGDYQLYADEVQPDGLGTLYLAFEQLKERLLQEGLFDPQKKRSLPLFPKTIALVTSATGAAVRDMIITLRRRYPLALVRVIPVAVQGDEAPKQIAQGIEWVCQYALADVMIVGRGGGSFEELFSFNTEVVARAISAATIPVVSAVGHETDTTIADFVADVRAATPTAAAELVSPDIEQLALHLDHLQTRLLDTMRKLMESRRVRLERVASSRTLADPMRFVSMLQERMDRLEKHLQELLRLHVNKEQRMLSSLELRLAHASPLRKVDVAQVRLDSLDDRLRRSIQSMLTQGNVSLTGAIERLELLSPLSVMKRGYAIIYDQANKVLASTASVQPGDTVRVDVLDGWLDCQVWGVYERDG